MLAILDYEAGNQTSVLRALKSQGIAACITADATVLAKADGVIFPGVGAAGQAMGLLQSRGLDKILAGLVAQGKPLLGICLGCQIILDYSEENHTRTLGILPGRCLAFKPAPGLPVPHMGWNSVEIKAPCPLFANLPSLQFYFVHSYYPEPPQELVLGRTEYGLGFASVFGRNGLWAAQFHPEKSGPAGLQFLANFNSWCLEQKPC